jgi:ribose/xylose/arabinose/galactoside ABC-type transport system permease subunit
MSVMGNNNKNFLLKITKNRDIGVIVAAIVIAVFFTIASPVFFSAYNLFNLLRQTAQLGIIAMSMTMLIVVGEIDLSVGAIYAVTGVVTGILVKTFHIDIWPAAFAGFLVALSLGAINGALISATRINSFIATLSTQMIFRGIAMVLSQGQPFSFLQSSSFFNVFARSRIFGDFPVQIIWLAAWGVFSYFLLHRTTFGIKIFATGDNRVAADLSGIKTMRIKRICFILTASAAGLSALISLAFLKTVTPTQGGGLELEAIAAGVLGGTSMSGGVGSILGTFIGAFIMSEIRTGLVLMGTDAYVQDAFVGLVIALAVIINVRINYSKNR